MILMGTRCWRGHGNGRYMPNGSCVTCQAIKSKASHKPVTPKYALWQDGEYQFLRDLGLTPQEIGEKHGVKWESFQRTLHRRLGAKTLW